MFGLNTTQSCRPYFTKFKTLTLPSLFIYEVAIFVKVNPHLFSSLSDIVRLCIIPSNTALMHNSVFCLAPVIFNKIPKSIKQLTVTKFISSKKIFYRKLLL